MTEVEQQQAPQNGIDLSAAEDDDNSKSRPADIEQDMREMERRKRVEAIMSSKLFREELERIVDSAREGGTSGILQQLSDIVGVPASRVGSVFKTSNCMVPINDIRGVESMGYAKGEKILRCKLAATFRLLDLYGWTQGLGALISARLKVDQEYFLVNPYGLMFHEITASSLNKVDMQGNIVEQGTTNFGVNKGHFILHSVVHAARPDIRCAIYIGCSPVVAVSSLKTGLLPITKDACVLGEITTHAYTGSLDIDERDKLVRNLGPISKVMLLSNHGALCCGETIEEAFFAACHIVQACETQLKLLPVGLDNLVLIPEESRKHLYEQSRRPPEDLEKKFAAALNNINATSAASQQTHQQQDGEQNTDETAAPTKTATNSTPKWRVGGAEFEALMRMLDNAGYRTGYIYRHPLIKSDPPKPKNDVELPPAVSSLGYLLEEEELFKQGIWKKGDIRKGGDRSRWLNSPNVYQKVEVLETGTPDPKKITKWVAEGSPTHSTPVRIEDPLQFVPVNTNPKEFKRLQQQIKDNRRADKISAGPQSHILEGVTWDEANRIKDATVSQTGDHVVLMGAASKGIIQRGFQHNATVYKAPYAKNPFDNVTDDELNEYKRTVERKKKSIHGEYTDTDFSESEALSSQQTSGAQQTKQTTTSTTAAAVSQSEPEDISEHQVMRIETQQAPVPSQPEVVLSDATLSFINGERSHTATNRKPPTGRDIINKQVIYKNKKNKQNHRPNDEYQDQVEAKEEVQCLDNTGTSIKNNLNRINHHVNTVYSNGDGGVVEKPMLQKIKISSISSCSSINSTLASLNLPANTNNNCIIVDDCKVATIIPSTPLQPNSNSETSIKVQYLSENVNNYSSNVSRQDYNNDFNVNIKNRHSDELVTKNIDINQLQTRLELLAEHQKLNLRGQHLNTLSCSSILSSVSNNNSGIFRYCGCHDSHSASMNALQSTSSSCDFQTPYGCSSLNLSAVKNNPFMKTNKVKKYDDDFEADKTLTDIDLKDSEILIQDLCPKGFRSKSCENMSLHNNGHRHYFHDLQPSSNKNIKSFDTKNFMRNCNTPTVCLHILEAMQRPLDNNLIYNIPFNCGDSGQSSLNCTPRKSRFETPSKRKSYALLNSLNKSPYRTVSHFGFNSPQRIPKPDHKHLPSLEANMTKYRPMRRSTSFEEVFSSPRYADLCDNCFQNVMHSKPEVFRLKAHLKNLYDTHSKEEMSEKSAEDSKEPKEIALTEETLENKGISTHLDQQTRAISQTSGILVDQQFIETESHQSLTTVIVKKSETSTEHTVAPISNISSIAETSNSASSILGRICGMNFSNESTDLNFVNETPHTVSSNFTIEELISRSRSKLDSIESGHKIFLYKLCKETDNSSKGASESEKDIKNINSYHLMSSSSPKPKVNVSEFIDFGNWPAPLNPNETKLFNLQKEDQRDDFFLVQESNSEQLDEKPGTSRNSSETSLIRRKLVYEEESIEKMSAEEQLQFSPNEFPERSSTPKMVFTFDSETTMNKENCLEGNVENEATLEAGTVALNKNSDAERFNNLQNNDGDSPQGNQADGGNSNENIYEGSEVVAKTDASSDSSINNHNQIQIMLDHMVSLTLSENEYEEDDFDNHEEELEEEEDVGEDDEDDEDDDDDDDDDPFHDELLNLCNNSEHFNVSVLDVIMEESGEEDAEILHDQEQQDNQIYTARTETIFPASENEVSQDNLELVLNAITEAVILDILKEQGVNLEISRVTENSSEENSLQGDEADKRQHQNQQTEMMKLGTMIIEENNASKDPVEMVEDEESSGCSELDSFAKYIFGSLLEDCSKEECKISLLESYYEKEFCLSELSEIKTEECNDKHQNNSELNKISYIEVEQIDAKEIFPIFDKILELRDTSIDYNSCGENFDMNPIPDSASTLVNSIPETSIHEEEDPGFCNIATDIFDEILSKISVLEENENLIENLRKEQEQQEGQKQEHNINEECLDAKSKSSDSLLTFVVDSSDSSHSTLNVHLNFEEDNEMEADDEMESSPACENLSKKVIKFIRSKTSLKPDNSEKSLVNSNTKDPCKLKKSKKNKKSSQNSNLEWYVNLFSSDETDEIFQENASNYRENLEDLETRNSSLAKFICQSLKNAGVVPVPQSLVDNLNLNHVDMNDDLDESPLGSEESSKQALDTAIDENEVFCAQLEVGINDAMNFDFEQDSNPNTPVSNVCALKRSCSDSAALKVSNKVSQQTIEQFRSFSFDSLTKCKSFPDLRQFNSLSYHRHDDLEPLQLICKKKREKYMKKENHYINGDLYDSERADGYTICESLKGNHKFFRSVESTFKDREENNSSEPDDTARDFFMCGDNQQSMDDVESGLLLSPDDHLNTLNVIFHSNKASMVDYIDRSVGTGSSVNIIQSYISYSDLESDDENEQLSLQQTQKSPFQYQQSTDVSVTSFQNMIESIDLHYMDSDNDNEQLSLNVMQNSQSKQYLEKENMNMEEGSSYDLKTKPLAEQTLQLTNQFDSNSVLEEETFDNTFVTVVNYSTTKKNSLDETLVDSNEFSRMEMEILEKIDKHKLAEEDSIFNKIEKTIRNKLTPSKLEELVKRNSPDSATPSSSRTFQWANASSVKGSVLQKAKLFQDKQNNLLDEKKRRKEGTEKPKPKFSAHMKANNKTWPPKSNINTNHNTYSMPSTTPLRSSGRSNIEVEEKRSASRCNKKQRNFVLENIRNAGAANRTKSLQNIGSPFSGASSKVSLGSQKEANVSTDVFSFQSRLVRGSPSFWVSIEKPQSTYSKKNLSTKNDSIKKKLHTYRKENHENVPDDLSSFKSPEGCCSTLSMTFEQSPNSTIVDNEIAALGEQIQQLQPRLNAYQENIKTYGENVQNGDHSEAHLSTFSQSSKEDISTDGSPKKDKKKKKGLRTPSFLKKKKEKKKAEA